MKKEYVTWLVRDEQLAEGREIDRITYLGLALLLSLLFPSRTQLIAGPSGPVASHCNVTLWFIRTVVLAGTRNNSGGVLPVASIT